MLLKKFRKNIKRNLFYLLFQNVVMLEKKIKKIGNIILWTQNFVNFIFQRNNGDGGVNINFLSG